MIVRLLIAIAFAASAASGALAIARPATIEQPALHPPADVASPPAQAKTTASGIAMKVLKRGRGIEQPVDNDCVEVNFIGWKRDGTLFSTSRAQGGTAIQCLRKTMPGMVEALKSMKVGEKRRVWIPARLTFMSDEPGEPAPRVDLTFDVELLKIMKAPRTPPDLSAPPKSAFKTASGVVIEVLRKGTGTRHPTMASRVTLHFSGWTRDGTLFESTVLARHPAVFAMSEVLTGWREALQQMVVGQKVRLWIPAALAYGEKPRSHDAPAGDLVYDLELLKLE